MRACKQYWSTPKRYPISEGYQYLHKARWRSTSTITSNPTRRGLFAFWWSWCPHLLTLRYRYPESRSKIKIEGQLKSASFTPDGNWLLAWSTEVRSIYAVFCNTGDFGQVTHASLAPVSLLWPFCTSQTLISP